MSNKFILLIKKIISEQLNPEKNRVFIFGSRAAGDSSEFSDVDIGIEGEPLKAKTYFDLKSAFEESDLPFTVDIVEFKDVSEKFKEIAKQNIIYLN